MEFNAAKNSRMQLRGQTGLRLLRDAAGEACAGSGWDIKSIPMGKRTPTERHIGSLMILAVQLLLETHTGCFCAVCSQASNAGGGYAKSATGKRSVTASPEPKRAKSKEPEPVDSAAKPTKAKATTVKTTKTKTAKAKAAAANNTEAARAGDSPKAKRNAQASKAHATKSVLEDSSESDEDAPAAKAVRFDPDRRQKAVQQALAGAAAAKAAAKRAENGVERTYNLRSASSNGG